jgi:hypothetical protein
MRPTSLADARRDGLVPSVTTVLQMVAKPSLARWDREQYILSALTLPRHPGESDDDFACRVCEDAASVSGDAAALGREFHAHAERYHRTGHYQIEGGEVPVEQYHRIGHYQIEGGEVPVDPRMQLMLNTYVGWAKQHIGRADKIEYCFATDSYGGTVDLVVGLAEGGRALIDLKTRTSHQGRSLFVPREYGYQLAAYAAGLAEDAETKLWNVMVSSTEMGRLEVMDWTDEREDLYRAFQCAYEIWCDQKQYDPRKEPA